MARTTRPEGVFNRSIVSVAPARVDLCPPTAGCVEQLPLYAGRQLRSATVTAGSTATASIEPPDPYGSAVHEAGQPVRFTRHSESRQPALPNGGAQRAIPTRHSPSARALQRFRCGCSPRQQQHVEAGRPGICHMVVSAFGSLGSDPGCQDSPEYSQSFCVVPPSHCAISLTLTSGSATLSGTTLTVPAGTVLGATAATMRNLLGRVTSANPFDHLLFQSSHSGVASVGCGSAAAGSRLERREPYEDGPALSEGSLYLFGPRAPVPDGFCAVKAGAATPTAMDGPNAAMPSASFQVMRVLGAATNTPLLEYQGPPAESLNPVHLAASQPVELHGSMRARRATPFRRRSHAAGLGREHSGSQRPANVWIDSSSAAQYSAGVTYTSDYAAGLTPAVTGSTSGDALLQWYARGAGVQGHCPVWVILFSGGSAAGQGLRCPAECVEPRAIGDRERPDARHRVPLQRGCNRPRPVGGGPGSARAPLRAERQLGRPADFRSQAHGGRQRRVGPGGPPFSARRFAGECMRPSSLAPRRGATPPPSRLPALGPARGRSRWRPSAAE